MDVIIYGLLVVIIGVGAGFLVAIEQARREVKRTSVMLEERDKWPFLFWDSNEEAGVKPVAKNSKEPEKKSLHKMVRSHGAEEKPSVKAKKRIIKRVAEKKKGKR